MRAGWPDRKELLRTGTWIEAQQRSDGGIPWVSAGKLDPWDHVHSAMALAAIGQIEAARAAFRYLAKTQGADGAWPAASTRWTVLDPTRETNHAAHLASGLWFLYTADGDVDFLAEMRPTLDRALAFVLGMQHETGVIWWAKDGRGNTWTSPLLTGCSSIHGSLVCAERIAQRLGEPRPEWTDARVRLARAVRDDHKLFHDNSLPEPVGRYAMDWYYPVLCGVVRGPAARDRLVEGRDIFLGEGGACRCVRDRPWYTVAETCELVVALHISGLTEQAHDCFTWAQSLRESDGGYWIGITYPEGLVWPPRRPTWTAGMVILAADALEGESRTSRFFFELGEEP
jgi:hypothetical protein